MKNFLNSSLHWVTTSQSLEIESIHLAQAFMKFLTTNAYVFSHMEILTISFKETSFCRPSMLSSEFTTYHMRCYLQWCTVNDMPICLYTGCSMSSTFLIDDFGTPSSKGKLSQLKTIATVVPIVGAGIICWHVYDSDGNDAIICIPGYYIPSLTQCLLSPQNYAMFHGWGSTKWIVMVEIISIFGWNWLIMLKSHKHKFKQLFLFLLVYLMFNVGHHLQPNPQYWLPVVLLAHSQIIMLPVPLHSIWAFCQCKMTIWLQLKRCFYWITLQGLSGQVMCVPDGW